jgi:hypothetical protein
VNLHKALFGSKIAYGCSTWEFPPDKHLLIFQCLQNKVLRTTDNFSRLTPVRDLHMVFELPCLYYYISNYVGNKQKSYKIMKMKMFATLDKEKPDTGSKRCLNFAAVKYTTVQVTTLLL